MDINNNDLNKLMQMKAVFKKMSGGKDVDDYDNAKRLPGGLRSLKKVINNLEQKDLTYDVNGDGDLNINDLILANKGVNLIKNGTINKKELKKLSEEERNALDINGDGKITAKEMKFLKGEMDKIKEKFEEDGCKVKINKKTGKITTSSKETDDEGNTVRTTKVYNSKTGKLESKKITKTDDEGNKTTSKSKYKYDKEGNLIKKTTNKYNNNDNSNTKTVTKYDEEGNKTSKVTTVTKNYGKRSERVSVKKITKYNDDGSYSVKTVKISKDGSKTIKKTEYDENDEIIKTTTTKIPVRDDIDDEEVNIDEEAVDTDNADEVDDNEDIDIDIDDIDDEDDIDDDNEEDEDDDNTDDE